VLDRLDLDTDKPSDEELAKRFGYEDAYYNGKTFYQYLTISRLKGGGVAVPPCVFFFMKTAYTLERSNFLTFSTS